MRLVIVRNAIDLTQFCHIGFFTELSIYANICIFMRNSAYYTLMKEVIWMGSSKVDLKAFPAAVVDDVGHQLFLVQCGI